MFAAQPGGPPPPQQQQPPQEPPVGSGPSSYRSPEGGGPTQEAATQQLAQAMAAQQIEQAKQQFMQATQVVVSLGEQFPDMADRFNQIGAAIMQLASEAIATLQPEPIAPPMG